MASILPSFLPEWEIDENRNECHGCGVQFTMLRRKHHCRTCGKIYCGTCSTVRQSSMPSFVNRLQSGNNPIRTCETCNTLIAKQKKNRHLILIFSCLPLPIRELEVLLIVCKKWKNAITCIIASFKAIPYKDGYRRWNGLERRLIQTHWREFVGHNRLMVQTLKAIAGVMKISDIVRYYKCSTKKYQCSELYCDNCSSTLTPYDILDILFCQQTPYLLSCEEFESWVGTLIVMLSKHWCVLFIPWLMQIGTTPAAQRIIVNNILPLALDSIEVAYAMYFECELLKGCKSGFWEAIQGRLMACLSASVRNDLQQSHNLFYVSKTDVFKLRDLTVKGIRLPYDPNTCVKKIYCSQIRQLNSSTKPWVIPVETTRGKILILQKHDDLRKDRLVVSIMRFLSNIHPLEFDIYPVFCQHNVGWVEMIQGAKTLYDINKTSTIQNFIISMNLSKSAVVLRDIFVRSCTSNCVLGYMLGIGDRNLHNILITQKGTIMHIDFSFILGFDPKNIESTEMKITSGMLDMLGGLDSTQYKQMKNSCASAYTEIRKYTYFWYAIFRYLAVAVPPVYPHTGDLKAIQDHIDSRLMPNASEAGVKLAIIKSVDSNSNSWNSSISDLTHSLGSSIGGLLFNLEL